MNHPVSYADDYKTVAQRQIQDSLSGDQLLRNDNHHFTNVTTEANIYSSSIGYGLGIAVGDLNNDGWTDIYVSNDFKENDYCYLNNGDGTFREQANNLFAHTSRFSMGNDMADVNNDGWLDVVTLDMLSQDEKIVKTSVADDDIEVYDYKHHFGFHYQFSKNCLQQNIDGHSFVDIGLQQGIAATDWSWAPLLADFDNDGKKDLFISNGFKYRVNDLDFNVFVQNTMVGDQRNGIVTNKRSLINRIPNGAVPDYLYLNKGDNGFADVSVDAGFTTPTLSNGAAYGDLDNDGDLDLVVNRMGEAAGIYQNNMPRKHSVAVRLRGSSDNSFGIGAKLYAFSSNGMQLLQQSAVRGFMSSVSPTLHVGLDTCTQIDSMLIVWPSGKGEWIQHVPAGKTLVLDEQQAAANITLFQPKTHFDTSWTKDASLLPSVHTEDAFDDLNRQPFLPHSLATQGPALASGDVNGDGLTDVFTGGATNTQSAMWIQQTDGHFVQTKQPALEHDSLCEDTDALFFDADGDKDLDLYVASGGNEWFGKQAALNDRLYINDGKGNFEKSRTLPLLYENSSCVAACDWDRDGDVDLFVGGRANARMYGYTPASVLLQNDGKGNFTELTNALAAGLQTIGMVTCAAWADVDGDGWNDLIMAGEWMPITVYKNTHGTLQKQVDKALDKSNGWWNCMYADDIDGDGDKDFLLGNWGQNSKLKATVDYPLQMNIADWDNNGETDPILSVANQEHYYPFLGKSDLEKRLPMIKKQFLQYRDAAGKTTEQLFGKKAVAQSQVWQAFTLQSSVLWNEGGQLRLAALPSFLQRAPIFSFAQSADENGNKRYVAGGNFYEVAPYEGRYDAMLPTLFQFHQQTAMLNGYVDEKGCVRKIKSIAAATGKEMLLLAKNNDTLTVLTKK